MTRPLKTVPALFAMLLSSQGDASQGSEFEAGVAAVEITPPKGFRMAGYFAERLNTGTHDPLHAKAIVFRQGGTQAALVFCDLVGVPRAVAAEARKRASRKTGIPEARIAVAATHSHTGPLYYGVLRKKFHEAAVARDGRDNAESVDYADLLADKVAEAVSAAQKALVPVRIEAGLVRREGLAFNRRFHMKDGTVRFNPGALNPEIVRAAGPTDPDVGLVLVSPAAGGAPVAGLSVFALHLDTVNGTEYSADYPAVVQDKLRKTFGPKFLSLFGAGTCGDINHIDVTTRDRARTAAIGESLARTIVDSVPSLTAIQDPRLDVLTEAVALPVQKPDMGEVTAARTVLGSFVAGKTPFLEIVKAAKVVDLADNYPDPSERFDVQAFRLSSDLAIVTLPGEVFVEHGLAVKQGSPFKTTLVIELANASPAYVPTLKAFSEGSYEVVNSRVSPGGGETLVKTALGLLERLKTSAR